MRKMIQEEVVQRFGLVPNFFRMAQQDSEMAAQLWRFASFAYLDNPLPSLFKERLFVWLSRFCPVRYCIARHIGFLVGLGHAGGDPACTPQSVDEVVHMLKRPVPRLDALRNHIDALDRLLPELPEPGAELEASLFACATQLFREPTGDGDSLRALARALGPARLEYLQELIAFVHVAHHWTVLHPELAFEDDIKQLLETHQELSEAVLADPEAQCSEPGQRLVDELALLREEKQQLMHASGRRLQQDLADSRLLHEISNELINEQRIDILYEKLIMAAARLLRASGGSIQVLVQGEDGGPELDLLANCGLAPEARQFWQRVRIGSESSCGEALAHGSRIVVDDVARCEFMVGTEDLTMYLKSNIHAVQTTPLRSRDGTMVGCISTYWAEPHQPAEHELRMFDILVRQAADLIERARVEDALRASEERCRRALQPQNVGVLFFDAEGRVIEANEAFLQMSGYARDDVEAGLSVDRMTPPEWQGSSRRAMEQLRSAGHTAPYEKEYLRKDGSRWWGLCAATQLSGHESVKFVIDITDRKLAEQAVREADQRKDVFLATLAHELRNPLAPISNVVHLLRQTDGRRRADKLMEMMERQVHQIVRLVDDLLEVSRIAGGKVRLDPEPVALADIVRDAVETSMPQIEQGRHALEVALPPQPVTLQGDRVRLAQVLSNLLNNAARFTPPGGHIWLSAERSACDVVISVRDDGEGIPPDKLPGIFDLFAQVESGTSPDHGGLGIGLTMARSLVEMHGGTVTAHSAGPGTGSEFRVRLPLPPDGKEADRDAGARDAGLPLAGQRILVVDDNRDAADTLMLLLEVDGADVRVAYDGEGALAVLAAFPAQAVLLDLGMTGMDGYEVAQRIREDPRFAGVRIAALTGWGQDADRRQTRACGFDTHLTKPVDLEELKRWLRGG